MHTEVQKEGTKCVQIFVYLLLCCFKHFHEVNSGLGIYPLSTNNACFRLSFLNNIKGLLGILGLALPVVWS